jgi:DNA-binding NarL/FixJ family response regulator
MGLRILIADDHIIVRHGLKEMLTERFSGAVFGEAGTAQETLDQLREGPWDILVLDVTMPGRSGLEILHEISRAQPRLPVLVLSMHPDEQYALRVLEAGAAGYISKDRASAELVAAVKTVLSGGRHCSPAVAETLVSHLSGKALNLPHERLSNREFELLRLLASGKPAKAIAREVSVSAQTISTHRARIVKKLGLHSTAELIRYAVQNRLVDQE